jgi:hypothetical protein
MDTDEHLDVIERIESYINFIKEQMFDKFNINYETLTNPNWNEIAEQNHSNFLSYEMGLDINSENENYSSDLYNYEEYENDDYDFEKEKINSWQIINEYNIFEDDDLPF